MSTKMLPLFAVGEREAIRAQLVSLHLDCINVKPTLSENWHDSNQSLCCVNHTLWYVSNTLLLSNIVSSLKRIGPMNHRFAGVKYRNQNKIACAAFDTFSPCVVLYPNDLWWHTWIAESKLLKSVNRFLSLCQLSLLTGVGPDCIP